MNKVELIGRVTSTPELKYTSSNKANTRFTLAVNRNHKTETGETLADFISIVAWESKAETICKYIKKGNKIGIVGRIQTGSYDKQDGSKGYTTDVIVSELEFLESKPKDDIKPEENTPVEETPEDPFADFGNNVVLTEDDLPFWKQQ